MRLRATAALGALLLAAAAAGCGGGTTAAPPATTAAPTTTAAAAAAPARSTACVRVPAGLDRAILSRVVLANARLVKTRGAMALAMPGYYYVSALVAGDGTKNLLATWATRDLQGKREIYSVDANAALISQYGASTGVALDLSVDAPGSYRSRTCVAGPGAPHGAPAPPSGGGAPAGK